MKWFWKNNLALFCFDTLPSILSTHEKYHVSLISTWTVSHCPQLWVWPCCQFFICWLVWLSNPCLSKLETRVWCGTVSKAFHKSRENVSCFSFAACLLNLSKLFVWWVVLCSLCLCWGLAFKYAVKGTNCKLKCILRSWGSRLNRALAADSASFHLCDFSATVLYLWFLEALV